MSLKAFLRWDIRHGLSSSDWIREPVLVNLHGLELTGLKTHAALDAFLRVDFKRFPFILLGSLFARDRLRRTSLGTSATGGAEIGGNLVCEKGPANPGRTPFVEDMLLVFVSEITNRRENRIGGCDSQLT